MATFYLVAVSIGSYILAFGAWAGVWLAVLCWRDLRGSKILSRLRGERQNLKMHIALIQASFPLAVVALLNALYSSIPIIFLTRAVSAREIGVFAASSYLTMAVGLLVSSVALASAKPMAESFSQGRTLKVWREIGVQLVFVATLCGPLVVAFWVGGSSLLKFLYGQELAGYGSVLTVQMVGVALMLAARVAGTAGTAIGRNFEQAVIGAVCVGILVALCAWLVPMHGLLGAAWAVAAAFLLKFLSLLMLLLWRLR